MVSGLLAEVVRGDLVESRHHGHLVTTAPSASSEPGAGPGGPGLSVGDPDATIWPRSAVKPVQAVALLRVGLRIDDRGLALACASHSGDAGHLAVVRAVLAAAGLTESELQNTPDLPLDPEAAARWRHDGGAAASVTQNCSGKHAAMLATCVQLGWDTAGYRDAEHPVQRHVRSTLAELTGVDVRHVTVDGCGAPLFSTTTRGLARALGRIAGAPRRSPGSPEARVARAMAAHPELVGGAGRDVTRLMAAVPGLVAKDGADGVYAAGLPDGSGMALKVDDGSARPRAAVVARTLEVMLERGAVLDSDPAGRVEVVERLRAVGRTPVLGHGRPVGEVRVAFRAGRT